MGNKLRNPDEFSKYSDILQLKRIRTIINVLTSILSRYFSLTGKQLF
jgi:hypothetical protein